jgi:hypothetical protein
MKTTRQERYAYVQELQTKSELLKQRAIPLEEQIEIGRLGGQTSMPLEEVSQQYIALLKEIVVLGDLQIKAYSDFFDTCPCTEDNCKKKASSLLDQMKIYQYGLREIIKAWIERNNKSVVCLKDGVIRWQIVQESLVERLKI